MTAWNPDAVAGFAKRAGWIGRDLGEAVAVALTCSKGHDDAYVKSATPPIIIRRGLWLLSSSSDDPEIASLLFQPQYNANAAHDLWERAGESWLWHPSYLVDEYAQWLPVGVEAAKHPAESQPAQTMFKPPDGLPFGRTIRNNPFGTHERS